jgi:prophage regulatory protein
MAFLSDKSVGERYDVSRVTVWRWRKTVPGFPAPITLSPGCVRWRLEDLVAWEAVKAGAPAPTVPETREAAA